jgi:hypothetical protein
MLKLRGCTTYRVSPEESLGVSLFFMIYSCNHLAEIFYSLCDQRTEGPNFNSLAITLF